MSKINLKEIKEKVNKMNDGWVEGAPTIELGGLTQTEFAAAIADAAGEEAELADILEQAELKRAEIETKYVKLNADRVKIGNGVRGNPDYGPDSPLYGAMGFIRDSERASGLTRKTKTPTAK